MSTATQSVVRTLAPSTEARSAPAGSDLIAPDCRGQNFWTVDRSLRDLLSLYLEPKAPSPPNFSATTW